MLDLEVIPRGNIPIIHGDLGSDRLIPLPLLGEGMNKLCSYGLAISNAENGFVLIDEIENGLHYSVLEKIWKGIIHLARKSNVQVITTTHSEECIRAAHSSMSDEKEYELKLHRLDRVDEGIEVTTYDKDTLGPAIDQGFEVR